MDIMMLCKLLCMIFRWNFELIDAKLVPFKDDTINLYGCSVMPEDAEWEQYYSESAVLTNPLDYSIAPYQDREDDVQFIYITKDLKTPVKLFIETYSRSVLVTFSDGEINWKDCAFDSPSNCVEKQKFTPTFSSNIEIQGCFCIADDKARIMFGIVGMSGVEEMNTTVTFFITKDPQPEDYLNFYFDLERNNSMPRIYVQGRHRYLKRKDFTRSHLLAKAITELSNIRVSNKINNDFNESIQDGDKKSSSVYSEFNVKFYTATDSKVNESTNRQIIKSIFTSTYQDDQAQNSEATVNSRNFKYQTTKHTNMFENFRNENAKQLTEGYTTTTNQDTEMNTRRSFEISKVFNELKNNLSEHENAIDITLKSERQKGELSRSISIIDDNSEFQITKQPKTLEHLNNNIGKMMESTFRVDEQRNIAPINESYSESKTFKKLSNNFHDQEKERFMDSTLTEYKYKSTMPISDINGKYKTSTAYPKILEKIIRSRGYMNNTFDQGSLNQNEDTFNIRKVEENFAIRGRSAIDVDKEKLQNISEENGHGNTRKNFEVSTLGSTMGPIYKVPETRKIVMDFSATQIFTTLSSDAAIDTSIKKLNTETETTQTSTKRILLTATDNVGVSTLITTLLLYVPTKPPRLPHPLLRAPLLPIKLHLTSLSLITTTAKTIPLSSTTTKKTMIAMIIIYEDVRELPPIGWIPTLTF